MDVTKVELWTGVALALVLGGCNEGSRRGAPPPEAGWRTVSGGSLVEARVDHQATVLADQRVLISGGSTAESEAVTSAELYDPAAGWSQPLVASMAQARAQHGSWRLPDGRVWLFGGCDPRGRPLRSTELFDPATGTFEPGPVLASARVDAAVAEVGDELWIVGGQDAPNAEVWRLDPLRLDTERGFPLPRSLAGAQLVPVTPEVWALVGGRDLEGRDTPPVWVDIERRRAVAQSGGEWLQGGAGVHHVGALGAEAWVLGGTLASSGAYTREGQSLSVPPRLQAGEVGAYPPAFDPETFDTQVVVGEPRTRVTAVSTPGGVLVVGGRTQGLPSAAVERVERGRTAVGQPLQVPRARVRATVLDDGRAVLTGGVDTLGRRVALVEQIVPEDALGPNGDQVFAQREAELSELARLRDTLARVRAELDAERQLTASLRAELSAALAALRQREAQVASLQGQLAQVTAQLGQSQQQAQALRAQLQALQQQLTQTQVALSAAQAEVTRLQAALGDAQAELARLRGVEADLRDQLAAEPAPAPAPPPATTLGPRSAPPRIAGPISGIVQGRPRTN